MRTVLLALLACSLAACSKKSDTERVTTTTPVQKVKYQVSGSGTKYEVTFTNELGQVSYAVVDPGWSTTINATAGRCYKLIVTPRPDCSQSGTGGIYFDDALKASKSVTAFTENVPNSVGSTSCGFQIEACNQ